MGNKLRDAYQRKVDRADAIVDRLRVKRAKLGQRSGRAKSIEDSEKIQTKIAKKEDAAYNKVKRIKSKTNLDLGGRAERFLDEYEKEKKYKQQQNQMKMSENKPTIQNFYGQ